MHSPVGYLCVGPNMEIPFVKAEWYWEPVPKKNVVGLPFLTTVKMQSTDDNFISPIWHVGRILDVGISLAPVDQDHNVPSPIRVGGRNVERGNLRVVIESQRKMVHTVEDFRIDDVFEQL